jgi:hypothetical protein
MTGEWLAYCQACSGAGDALCVTLHAIGGLATASFYIPYNRLSGCSWETWS